MAENDYNICNIPFTKLTCDGEEPIVSLSTIKKLTLKSKQLERKLVYVMV